MYRGYMFFSDSTYCVNLFVYISKDLDIDMNFLDDGGQMDLHKYVSTICGPASPSHQSNFY